MRSAIRTCIVVGQWEMIEKLHMGRLQLRCEDDAGSPETAKHEGRSFIFCSRF